MELWWLSDVTYIQKYREGIVDKVGGTGGSDHILTAVESATSG